MSLANVWAIFDIDGTLSNDGHRVHMAMAGNHAGFDAKHELDATHTAEAMLLRAWMASGHKVAYMTGRSEAHRASTVDWFQRHGLPFTCPLYMRGQHDVRSTVEVKREMLQRHMAKYPDAPIAFIMDDHQGTVDLFRSMGYTVLQPRVRPY